MKRPTFARLGKRDMGQMSRSSRPRHAPAAVATDDAAAVARVVPTGAKTVTFGKRKRATLGYLHTPTRLSRPFSQARQRLREIEALIRHRHDGPCSTDDGLTWFEAAAPHFETREHAFGWAGRWLPRLALGEAAAELDRIEGKEPRLRADRIAQMLRVTRAERETLGLKTIGAIDLTKRQRMLERKARDREYQRSKRAASRATPRDRSAAQVKPWVAEGVSRATWYRRKEGETNSSALIGEQLPTNSSHADDARCERAPEGARLAVKRVEASSPWQITLSGAARLSPIRTTPAPLLGISGAPSGALRDDYRHVVRAFAPRWLQ